MKYTPLKYKDILALFDNTSELKVFNENTYAESIFHKPTGWYFYTTTNNSIICFRNDRGGEVTASTLSFMIQELFTKPARRIQKAVYETKTTK